jgi:hypothetical protein
MTESKNKAMRGLPVCFVETPLEADAFITHCRESDIDPRSITVVALTLDVQPILRRRGIPFETTLALFGQEGHEEALVTAEELLRRIRLQVDLRLDSEVIRETYHDTFHFKIQYYIHHFLFVLRVVEGAIAKYRPSEVLHLQGPGPLSANPDQLLLPSERWANRIVELYCEAHGLRSAQIENAHDPEPEPATEARGVRPSVPWALRLVANKLNAYVGRSPCVLYSGSFDGFRTLSSQLRASARRLILLDDTPLTWRRAITSWVRALSGRGVVLPTGGNLAEAPDWATSHEKALVESIEALQVPSAGVEYKGVSFWQVYEEKVRLHLLPSICIMSSRFRTQLNLASSLPLSHVVVTAAREMAYAFCEYAKWCEIPSVMVSHGTVIAPKNRLEEIENRSIGSGLQLSPVVSAGAVQSRLEEAHVDHYAPPGTMYRTGPILFSDRDAEGRSKVRPFNHPDDEVTILMGSSCKNRASYRFWAMETPDEYLESCRDMIAAVAGIPNVRLVIRLHKKLQLLSTSDLMTLLSESDRITIDREGTFKDSLRSCDLVVSFASTTIEESLQNGVPVLLYDPWQRYQHCDGAPFHSTKDFAPAAVHYLDRRGQLRETLKAIVDRQLRGLRDSVLFGSYCYHPEETIGFAEMLDVSAEDASLLTTATADAPRRSCRIKRKAIPEGVGDIHSKVLGHSPLQVSDSPAASIEGGTGIAHPTIGSRG